MTVDVKWAGKEQLVNQVKTCNSIVYVLVNDVRNIHLLIGIGS